MRRHFLLSDAVARFADGITSCQCLPVVAAGRQQIRTLDFFPCATEGRRRVLAANAEIDAPDGVRLVECVLLGRVEHCFRDVRVHADSNRDCRGVVCLNVDRRQDIPY